MNQPDQTLDPEHDARLRLYKERWAALIEGFRAGLPDAGPEGVRILLDLDQKWGKNS